MSRGYAYGIRQLSAGLKRLDFGDELIPGAVALRSDVLPLGQLLSNRNARRPRVSMELPELWKSHLCTFVRAPTDRNKKRSDRPEPTLF